MKGWLRRLERAGEEELIVIPQRNGTPAKFPRSAYQEAFLNAMQRITAGEDAPPRHPLLAAARASSDPKWRESYFSDIDGNSASEPAPELFEK